MRNMKKWKRLMAVGLCSAMMFSMSVGVSATEAQDTDETAVETETTDETSKNINKVETILQEILQGDSGGSGSVDDEQLVQADGEALEEVAKEEAEAAEYAIETQANSKGLPEMEWDGIFNVSHKKSEQYGHENQIEYIVELSDEWKLDTWNDRPNLYVDGVLVSDNYGIGGLMGLTCFFDPIELSSKPLNVTIKTTLTHYSNGTADGTDSTVEISFVTDVEKLDSDKKSENSYYLPSHLVYDGTQELIFKLKNRTGDWAIKEINGLRFGHDFYQDITSDYFTYNAETGEITIPYWGLNAIVAGNPNLQMHNGLINSRTLLGVAITGGTYQNGKAIGAGGEDEAKYGFSGSTDYQMNPAWTIEYVSGDWSLDEEMPAFIDTSYEFDGTQDMVFNFKNGTGDNAIKAIKEVFFPIQEANKTDENGICLVNFHIGNYGTSFNYDISKGQVTLFKHAVSAIVYGEWEAVSNVYGGGFMVVELANGQTRTLYVADGDANWSVKILKKSESPEATGQHVINVTESLKEFDINQMQNLVDINKDHDVVLRTPEGVVFTFAKGTMRMVEGKDGYPFGVEIIADFNRSGITQKGVTSDIFVCRINFEYSGELPGNAKISIPVDNKWNGQTLYYYQVMNDGTLRNTGKSAKVENGIFDIMQDHCSDYVILAKSPQELGIADNDSQSNLVNTSNASPRTGDNNMILLFTVLCICSCVASVFTLKARRRIK